MGLLKLLKQAEKGAVLMWIRYGYRAVDREGRLVWLDGPGAGKPVPIYRQIMNDRWEIAQPAPGACQRCKGTGKDARRLGEAFRCDNQCPDCEGTGWGPKSCPRCGGKGVVDTVLSESEHGGIGMRKTCTDCNGVGKKLAADSNEKCKDAEPNQVIDKEGGGGCIYTN